MDLIQLFCLALIQGLTEFLPISSSAHLILPAQLLNWPDQGLAFDIAVHVGSLIAVITYFRRELAGIAGGGLLAVTERRLDDHAHLALQIGLATVPIVIAGLLFKEFVETQLRTVTVIAYATIGFGLLLGAADLFGRRSSVPNDRPAGSVGYLPALAIGAAQMLALIPGTSRSGITITAALFLGLGRERAARFSFLLAIPSIAGAGLLATLDALGTTAAADWTALGVGFAVSGVAAYLCIGAFMTLVGRTGMMPYVVYRIGLGLVLLLVL